MPLNKDEATELKARLQGAACELKINLDEAANRYTIWAENGPQGYLCWGKAPSPGEIYRQLGDQHHKFTEAVILEVTDSGFHVTRMIAEVW